MATACSFTAARTPAPPGCTPTIQLEEEEGLEKPFFTGSRHCSASRDNRLNKKPRPCFAFHAPLCLHAQFDFSPLHADKKARMKYLWEELFSDPSQWWDNRLTKKSSRQPDFLHKTKVEALWVDSWLNPPWVKEKVASMVFEQIKPSGGLTSRVPASFGNYDKVQKLAYEGKLKEALHLLELLARQTSQVPQGAFVCLLRGCTRRKALAEGKQVHALIVRTKCGTDIFLSNLLIGMYSDCGSVAEALKVFNAMPERNVFSWTAMISAHAKSRQYEEAVSLFQQMHQAGIEPDQVACIVALKACTNIAALEQGQLLHLVISKKGFDSDAIVQTSLVDMYAKCGCLEDARELFDNMSERDVISWNAMIAGYAQKGFGREALDLYEQMKHEGMEPSKITLVLLLKACASISALQQGKQLHSLILEKGLESEMSIQTTLVDMYAKCGCLENARELFDNMTERDIVSWNAMITGYAQKGSGKEALDLYQQMKHEGMEPSKITIVLLLKVCASISALQQGKQLHSLVLVKGLGSERTIQNTLIDMYAKCGCLKDARKLFDNMTKRDVISWNVMISGYAQAGLGKEALDLFKQMKDEGLQTDDITYSCVLSACSHSGLVDEGRHVFECMSKDRSVIPSLEHYGCMVDLLGRAGCLSDAKDLIMKMPMQPNEAIWISLLGAARKYGNLEIGKGAFAHIVGLEPENAAPYFLLRDIYSDAAGRMT